MIVEMRKHAAQREVDDVIARAKSLGFSVQLNVGTDKTVIAILGSNTGQISTDIFAVFPGVENVTRIMKPYKLASREFKPKDTVVKVSGIEIGGNRLAIMAGPCAVESKKQYGLPIITEVVDPHHVGLVAEYADILQVGTRNMQNFSLLTELGRLKHPVVLKRGLANTVTEWLTAADYLLAGGNKDVILCERGIRTFEDSARFSMDISSIPVIKKFSHLPIIVDPSHAAGHYSLVPAIARAAIAAGADGLLIEVHPNPKEALVDGLQSLTPSDFKRLMGEIRALAGALGRSI
jgi:3-deoxy-7-phosphoheptulonate synthase